MAFSAHDGQKMKSLRRRSRVQYHRGLGWAIMEDFLYTIMIIQVTFPSKVLTEGISPIAMWLQLADARQNIS